MRGFTLIEVLVALAILGLTAAAVSRQTVQVLGDLGQLEEKTRAFWVADEQLSRMLVRDAWPATGVRSRTLETLGDRWQVRIEVTGTPNPDVRRIQVRVSRDPAEQGGRVVLTGYGGRY